MREGRQTRSTNPKGDFAITGRMNQPILSVVQQFVQHDPDFMKVTLGNLISWGLILMAWYTSYIRQAQIFKDELNVIQRWITQHEIEAKARDNFIMLLRESNAKLSALVLRADHHFDKLELLAEKMFSKP